MKEHLTHSNIKISSEFRTISAPITYLEEGEQSQNYGALKAPRQHKLLPSDKERGTNTELSEQGFLRQGRALAVVSGWGRLMQAE